MTLVTCALAGLPTGCFWPMPGNGPNRQSQNVVEEALGPDSIASLDEIWTASLTGGAAADPVTSRHGVHVNTPRTVYGVNSSTGAQRWSYTPPAPLSVSQPIVNGNDLLVGQWDNAAAASDATEDLDVTLSLNAETGASRGRVLDGRIVALRGKEALAWDVSYYVARVGGPWWAGNFMVKDLEGGATRCCGNPYQLYSRNPPPPSPEPLTLGSEWIFAAGNGLNDPNDFGSFANGVRGISMDNPRMCSIYVCATWGVPIDGTTSTKPVLSDDESTVYVGTDAGTVYAVDPSTDSVRWSRSVGSAVTDSPALAGGSLYVPTEAGTLVALDASSGAIEWSAPAGSKITQQPAVAGGLVFFGSANGTVAAVNADGCGSATCSPIWSRSTGSEITGAPAVDRGKLYVGTANGRLVAFGL